MQQNDSTCSGYCGLLPRRLEPRQRRSLRAVVGLGRVDAGVLESGGVGGVGSGLLGPVEQLGLLALVVLLLQDEGADPPGGGGGADGWCIMWCMGWWGASRRGCTGGYSQRRAR